MANVEECRTCKFFKRYQLEDRCVCRRYPQIVDKPPASWCGEYVALPSVSVTINDKGVTIVNMRDPIGTVTFTESDSTFDKNSILYNEMTGKKK